MVSSETWMYARVTFNIGPYQYVQNLNQVLVQRTNWSQVKSGRGKTVEGEWNGMENTIECGYKN